MNKFTIKFIELSRFHKQLVMLFADLTMLLLALWAAYSMRLGELYLPQQPVVWLFLSAPFIAFPIFMRFGLYRAIIRYIGFRALWAVVQAVSLYAIVWGVIVLLSGIQGVPRSVILINWVVTILLIGGSRMIARWWFLGLFSPEGREKGTRNNVVVYGAGYAGVQLVTALVHGHESVPIAFVDDNRLLQGSLISGIRVYAPAELPDLVADFQVTQVLLAMSSASKSRRRRIIEELGALAVHVRTIPSVAELISGEAKVDEIREVDIEELLGRDCVAPDEELFDACILDKSVLVTGAGGSIGSELCRQMLSRRPIKLILFEKSEYMLFAIERELQALICEKELPTKLVPVLGDVLNKELVRRVMHCYGVHTLYHAAAYKHVPLVEFNMLEGVGNNVLGTLRTAQAAIENDVETFVLISTDKAVRPTNVMGASKRFAELILQALAKKESRTCFSMVRFGNVLDSSGSVVPLFRQQIRQGGPVTVTHPDIIRYFMTIPEAAQLVIQAGAMSAGGDVFVLDMGEPVKIGELARKMINLMGLSVEDDENPEGDIKIEYTGLRPGEKLYEELLIGKNVAGTTHPRILRAEEESISWLEIEKHLLELDAANTAFDCERLRKLLLEVVNGYQPEGGIKDLTWGQEHRAQAVTSVINIKDYHAKLDDEAS